MAEFLRDLADRPLDGRLARAVLSAGLAVTAGFCLLVGLGLVGGHGAGPTIDPAREPHPAPVAIVADPAPPTPRLARRRRQDRQDRPGTLAHRRAVAELATHRALQHVPDRRGGMSISLVGADGRRAVVRIVAATVPDARRTWRDFLARYRDNGRAYEPRFAARPVARRAAASPAGALCSRCVRSGRRPGPAFSAEGRDG